ncbi:MAG: hypothetical protein KF902_15270 [Phycisphaeraceae bacterium]|nr:hypothetical protein [Phycisphaeraceae bacterium]
MATWIVSPVESSVLPDGNGLYVLFTVLGLPAGFIPRSPEDSGGSSMVTTIGLDANWGRLVGWRFDELNREQFLLFPSDTERRTTIVRGRIVFIQPLSTAGDYAIRVLLELGGAHRVAMGAGLRTKLSDERAPLYIERFGPGFLTLRNANAGEPAVIASPELILSSAEDPSKRGMIFTDGATRVGVFPGFDRSCTLRGQRQPRLQYHWDAQAERSRVSSTQVFPPPTIPTMHDNRLFCTPAEAVGEREAQMLLGPVAGSTDPTRGYPYLRFTLDGTGTDVYTIADPAFRLFPSAATVGAVFTPESGSAATAVQTLAGRLYSTPDDPLPDHSQAEWRLMWNRIGTSANDWKDSEVWMQFSNGTTIPAVKVVTGKAGVRHCVVYRGRPGPTGAEFWVDGRRMVATAHVNSGNPNATGVVSIGARASPVSPGWIEPYRGQLEQLFIYDEGISDSALSAVLYESCGRAGIPIGGDIPVEEQTQPYTPSPTLDRKRWIDCKPLASIQLYIPVDRDLEDPTYVPPPPSSAPPNLLGQREEWRNSNQSAIEEFLRNSIAVALGGCDDYDILFNRPAGQYPDDIIASGIHGNVNTFSLNGATSDLSDKIITDTQMAALKAVWDDLGLSDHNEREGASFYSDDFARRGWFYTGGGLCLNEAGEVLDNARMSLRIIPPANAALYREAVLDKWVDEVAGWDDRFRCLILDSMNQPHCYPKFAEILHDSAADIAGEFTLVGEPIGTAFTGVYIPRDEPTKGPCDEPEVDTRNYATRKATPSFCIANLPSAPWWRINPATGRPAIGRRYNPCWAKQPNFDPTTMQFYIGIGPNNELDLTADKDGERPDDLSGNSQNLRIGDIYRFIRFGEHIIEADLDDDGETEVYKRYAILPVAWNGNYSKVGAAWDYATGRIPVGRIPMLSPRISRISR